MKFSSRDNTGFDSSGKTGARSAAAIEREDESVDRERCKRYLRKCRGVAAPTAGLHFSPEMMNKIREKGIETCELTLDVGLGTFRPVHTVMLEDHEIHTERYEMSEQTVEAISRARVAGRPIVAIGTTVVRALEDSARHAAEMGDQKSVLSGRQEATIFITPGYQFKVVSGLLTNFHLPKSTLVGVGQRICRREYVLAAYAHAIGSGYRFFSYGDCMLIR